MTATSIAALKAKMFSPLSQRPLRIYMTTPSSLKAEFAKRIDTRIYRIRTMNIALTMVRSFCSGAFSLQGMLRLSHLADALTVDTVLPEGRMILKIAASSLLPDFLSAEAKSFSSSAEVRVTVAERKMRRIRLVNAAIREFFILDWNISDSGIIAPT